MKRKKATALIMLTGLMFLLTGCYRTLRTPEQLYKTAKQKYGKCTVVSEHQDKYWSDIYVLDEAQNFVYRVKCTNTEFIDGTLNTFSIYDDFDWCFSEYVLQETEENLAKIADKFGILYKTTTAHGPNVYVYADTEEIGLAAADEILEEMKKYIYKNRMNEAEIKIHALKNGETYEETGTILVKNGKYVAAEE